ncbi:MAG: hypothetical protein L6Q97_17785 [Thermoanaerobaculia bacterium]|nr:hypothetical protein [Thermoanaerobaculia bacterium]
MNGTYSSFLIILTFWAMLFWGACQCRLPNGKSGTESGAAIDPTGTGLTGKRLEEMIVQLQELKKSHEELDEKRIELQKQYDAIPAEVKQNAVNCDQLAAQFDGHYEKSKMRLYDLNRIITSLKEGTPLYYVGDASDVDQMKNRGEWERNVPLEVLMTEYRNDIPQIEDEFQTMAKAIEQLKASIPNQGKGVVLFH